MLEFKSRKDLLSHYKAVSERLRNPQVRPAKLTVLEPEPELEPTPVPTPEPLPPITFRVVTDIPQFFTDPLILEGRVNFSDVIDLVVAHTQMRPSEIFARRRLHHVVYARQLLWALAYKHCDHLSLPRIARLSKTHATDIGYDHTTVLHAVRKSHTFSQFQELSDKLDELRKKRTPS